jgi:hypothetical protein
MLPDRPGSGEDDKGMIELLHPFSRWWSELLDWPIRTRELREMKTSRTMKGVQL